MENVQELRKQMEWYFKGQTMLKVGDFNEYCSEYNLDFNQEMGYAREKVEFDKKMDEYTGSTKNEQVVMRVEIESMAMELGLDFNEELILADQRKLLREEIKRYFSEGIDISTTEINEKCNNLKLNYNYEIAEIREKTRPRVSQIKMQEVEETVSKIMDDDECLYMIHGTDIDLYSSVDNNKNIKKVYEETRDEDNKFRLTKEALENAKERLGFIFNEGLYMREPKIDISAVDLETQARNNKGLNACGNEMKIETPRIRPETARGVLEDYTKNGFEKYPSKHVMVVLAIPKQCFNEYSTPFEYDDEGKILAGITGGASTLHYRIPKEYIKGAILRKGDEETAYFFANELYDKNRHINRDKSETDKQAISNDSIKAIAKDEAVAVEKENAQKDVSELEREEYLKEMDTDKKQEEI